jgi:hypothetical protein
MNEAGLGAAQYVEARKGNNATHQKYSFYDEVQ